MVKKAAAATAATHQLVVGKEIESWECRPLGLEVFLQALLYLVQRSVVRGEGIFAVLHQALCFIHQTIIHIVF